MATTSQDKTLNEMLNFAGEMEELERQAEADIHVQKRLLEAMGIAQPLPSQSLLDAEIKNAESWEKNCFYMESSPTQNVGADEFITRANKANEYMKKQDNMKERYERMQHFLVGVRQITALAKIAALKLSVSETLDDKAPQPLKQNATIIKKIKYRFLETVHKIKEKTTAKNVTIEERTKMRNALFQEKETPQSMIQKFRAFLRSILPMAREKSLKSGKPIPVISPKDLNEILIFGKSPNSIRTLYEASEAHMKGVGHFAHQYSTRKARDAQLKLFSDVLQTIAWDMESVSRATSTWSKSERDKEIEKAQENAILIIHGLVLFLDEQLASEWRLPFITSRLASMTDAWLKSPAFAICDDRIKSLEAFRAYAEGSGVPLTSTMKKKILAKQEKTAKLPKSPVGPQKDH